MDGGRISAALHALFQHNAYLITHPELSSDRSHNISRNFLFLISHALSHDSAARRCSCAPWPDAAVAALLETFDVEHLDLDLWRREKQHDL